MEVVPVIDLLHGQVVRAQRGERDRYRPIESGLCRSSEPPAVAQALLGLYPFGTLYIADLDAIRGHGSHFPTLQDIRSRHPKISLWLDAGFGTLENCLPWRELDVTFVVGSESLHSVAELRRMKESLGDRLVLSLDWRSAAPQGPAELFRDAGEWPRRVIVMTLSRVGSYEGPDFERLRQVQTLGRGRAIYAAGGVRDAGDLQALQAMGIGGALLASTLHDGRIDEAALAHAQQALAATPT